MEVIIYFGIFVIAFAGVLCCVLGIWAIRSKRYEKYKECINKKNKEKRIWNHWK